MDWSTGLRCVATGGYDRMTCMPYHEFFWTDAFLFCFNQNWGSEVVCRAYVYDVISFESVESHEYVGWQVSGGNMP